MVFLLGLAAEDKDVVHVDDHNPFVNELSEDVVHTSSGTLLAVSETKEHDKRFEQPRFITFSIF